METLHQGISTALMLVGIAVVLFGVAALWRSVANAKAQQQELQLERESHDRVDERLHVRAARDKSRLDLVYALVPAATALLGHWLGTQNAQPQRDPFAAPYMGRIPRPPPPVPPPLNDDDDTIELDLSSLLDALSELGFDRWLSTLMRGAKANHAAAPENDDPEPEPTVAPGMS